MVGETFSLTKIYLINFFLCFQNLALKMSDTATKALADTLGDPEEPFTPELEETATSVAGCLRNVMKGASQGAGSSSSSKVGLNWKGMCAALEHIFFKGDSGGKHCFSFIYYQNN